MSSEADASFPHRHWGTLGVRCYNYRIMLKKNERREGMDAETLRLRNRATILRAICTKNIDTRPKLVQTTGLTRMTISNIVNEMVGLGLVEVVPGDAANSKSAASDTATQRSPGPQPEKIVLAPSAPNVLAIWLDKLHLTTSVFALNGEPSYQVVQSLPAGITRSDLIEKLLTAAERAVNRTTKNIIGIGVAVPGIVNPAGGVLEQVIGFPGIAPLPLRSTLSERLKLPVYVANEINAAALDEIYFGYGREQDNFIYIGLTKGVGAAIVSGNRLVQSNPDIGGELGHISINFAGKLCECGNRGCLELYVSEPIVTAQISAAARCEFPDLASALTYARQSTLANVTVRKLRWDFLSKLAIGITNICNITGIVKIVLGHNASLFDAAEMAELQDLVSQRIIFDQLRSAVEIIPSEHRTMSSAHGAACILLDDIFRGRLDLSKTP